MLWKEVRSWAKSHGYESSKNEDSYSWSSMKDPTINGQCASVSKLARCIFNLMTNNQWIEHQKNYDSNK